MTAEKFLSNNSIISENDVVEIEDELNGKKKYLTKLPLQIEYVGDDPFKLVIDGVSKTLAEEIVHCGEDEWLEHPTIHRYEAQRGQD